MHAPLIFAGPKVPKGKQSEALCYLLDIFPTLGELADVSGPEGSEGKSLAGVLTGQKDDSLFTAYRTIQRAVRDDRWKLIVYPQVNKVQLFDLKSDPCETKDLADEPAHAGQVERLFTLLKEWQRQAGDIQPLRTDKPERLEFDFSKVQPVKRP
jgi:arylsulfatase A-like enzyme